MARGAATHCTSSSSLAVLAVEGPEWSSLARVGSTASLVASTQARGGLATARLESRDTTVQVVVLRQSREPSNV